VFALIQMGTADSDAKILQVLLFDGLRVLTIIKKQNQVTVDDRSYPVSDGDDSALFCFIAHCFLNDIICVHINGCSGLVQNKNFSFMQQYSCQANELSLP